MKLVDVTRPVQNFSFSFELTEHDMMLAFGGPNPDKDLFFALLGPGYDRLPDSGKLLIHSQVAELVEGARASTLNLTVSSIGPKPTTGSVEENTVGEAGI